MKSLWEDGTELPRFGRLEGDLSPDVLVIGGGMAGLLTAYELTRRGADVAVIEAGRVCGGVTRGTTAKITSQHGLIYSRLEEQSGTDAARLYYEANEEALARYRSLARGADCGFEERDAYVYSLTRRGELEREAETVRRIGGEAEITDGGELPFPTAGAVRFPHQAQFHPLRFLRTLLPELRIYEDTEAVGISGGAVLTPRGRIRAGGTVIATHFPFPRLRGGYFLKLCQKRSYVSAFEGAPAVRGMYVSAEEGGISLRSAGDLLLAGGGSSRPGKADGGEPALPAEFAARYFPSAREVYRWAAQDCMSLDGVPCIGRFSARTPDIFVATGFNKWGMTGSMAAALLLSDLVQGRPNRYEKLFSPSRTVLRPQLVANSVEAAADILTPAVPRCPHLGCALRLNAAERSWDCPCHGSRFGLDGSLLEGPATHGLKSVPTPPVT